MGGRYEQTEKLRGTGKCPISAAVLTDCEVRKKEKKPWTQKTLKEEPRLRGFSARQSKRLFKRRKGNNKVIEFIISDSVAEHLIRVDSCYSACFSLVHLTLHSCSAGTVNGNCQYWFITSSICGRNGGGTPIGTCAEMSEKDWSPFWRRLSSQTQQFLSDVLFVFTGGWSVRNIRFNNPTISWCDSDISGHFSSEFSSSGFGFFLQQPVRAETNSAPRLLEPFIQVCSVQFHIALLHNTTSPQGPKMPVLRVLPQTRLFRFFSVWKKPQEEQVVADQIQICRQSAEAHFISFGLIELLGI